MDMPSLGHLDYGVIACYMLLLVSIGFVFKSFVDDAHDFFVCGHKISWWMAGASAFMINFSAYTFTGLMGVAYRHGISALLISWNSMLVYLVAFVFIAARLRQTRCTTGMQVVAERFGHVSERCFSLISIPVSLFGGGVWLYGLGIFITAVLGIGTLQVSVLGIDLSGMHLVIIGTGLVICIYSTLGGSWAVQAADFVQTIIIIPITLVLAVFALVKVGGITEFIGSLPTSHFSPFNEDTDKFWFTAYTIQAIVVVNTIGGAQKYLTVRDSKAARKVALLAAILFFVGPIVWYIPPMAGRILYPSLIESATHFSKPEEAAYAVVTLKLLPAGLCGLMAAAMFGATMSSMDSALNANSGVVIINLYKGWLRKDAGTREVLVAGRLCNFVFAVLVILISIFYSNLSSGIFVIGIKLLSVLSLPLAIPCFLVFFMRRTPWWSALFATAIGGAVSFVGQCGDIRLFRPWAEAISSFVVNHGLWRGWAAIPWPVEVQSITTLAITSIAYGLTLLVWNWQSRRDQQQIESFYRKMETPVGRHEVRGAEDQRSLKLAGIFVMIIGGGIAALTFMSGYSPSDRLATGLTGGTLVGLGVLMVRVGRRSIAEYRETTVESPDSLGRIGK